MATADVSWQGGLLKIPAILLHTEHGLMRDVWPSRVRWNVDSEQWDVDVGRSPTNHRITNWTLVCHAARRSAEIHRYVDCELGASEQYASRLAAGCEKLGGQL